MRHRIDIAVLRDGKLNIQGWAFGKDPEEKPEFRIRDRQGKEREFRISSVKRDTVNEAFFSDYMKTNDIKRDLGFDIETEFSDKDMLFLDIRIGNTLRREKFNKKRIEMMNSHSRKVREKLLALINPETIEVSIEYFKENGFRALIKKGIRKIKGIQETYEYNEWSKLYRPEIETFDQGPMFSIVIPLYKTPEKFLRKLLSSIQAQTYGNFEAVLADATPCSSLGTIIRSFNDERFRYLPLGKNFGISENTNAAIREARGDFIVFSDHDDELETSALSEFARAVNENPEALILYSDEDKTDFEDSVKFEPHLKTDYNPDLLRSVNYICHLLSVKKSLLSEISLDSESGKLYERPSFDGAQDYDLILRCCEKAEERDKRLLAEGKLPERDQKSLKEGRYTSSTIIHIPKVLYHWRSHQESTAQNPESKLYAFEAGRRAIEDHLERIGLKKDFVEKGITLGFYHVRYKNSNPLVSVIIPNKDHREDLDKAIRSLIGGNYKHLEFIIVENNSEDPETFKYYEEIQKEFPLDIDAGINGGRATEGGYERPVVRVVRWEKEFNYSAINNFGTGFASGDFLLYLNNDIELIDPDSIPELLGLVEREDVGIAGARLIYPDGVIQHAGVVVGLGGIAGAAFVGIDDKSLTYMHRAKCIQDYSAVTAACLMTKKDIFNAVGGFTEELKVAFNDIDFCMKVRALGKKVVYDPYAYFYHYESKSRGLEDTPEKVERFNREIVSFAKKWPEILSKGDPYYHPYLTFMRSDFALKDLKKETPGKAMILDILRDYVK